MRPFTADEILAVLLYKEPLKIQPSKTEPPSKPQRNGLTTAFYLALDAVIFVPKIAIHLAAHAPEIAVNVLTPPEDRSFRRARGVFRTHGFTNMQIDVFLNVIHSSLHACMPCNVTTETQMDESHFLGVPSFGSDGRGIGSSGASDEMIDVQESIIRRRLHQSFDKYYRHYAYALTPGAQPHYDTIERPHNQPS